MSGPTAPPATIRSQVADAPPAWIDVAHPTRFWLFIRGLISLGFAAFFILGIVLMSRDALDEQNITLGLVAAFGLLLVWWTFAAGLVRVRVALSGSCFMQANEVAVRVLSMPDDAKFWTPIPNKPTEIRWADIKSCYPYTLRYGGIPAVRQLRFVMENGSGVYVFDLYPFRESSHDIVENLKRASASRAGASRTT